MNFSVLDHQDAARKPVSPRIQTKVKDFGKLFLKLANRYGEWRYYKWFTPDGLAEFFGFSFGDTDIGYEVANMLMDEFGIVMKHCRCPDGIHFRWYVCTKTSWKNVYSTLRKRVN